MKGKTHLLSGVTLALIYLIYSGVNLQNVTLSFLLVLGVLFPDIDIMNSILGRKIKVIGFIFKHRGFFHSIYSLMLFTYLFGGLFGWLYGLFFAIGFILHAIEDMLSKQGISLFMLGDRIKGKFVVGGLFEKVLNSLFLSSSIVLIIYLFLFI